jgi:hypothetical protein
MAFSPPSIFELTRRRQAAQRRLTELIEAFPWAVESIEAASINLCKKINCEHSARVKGETFKLARNALVASARAGIAAAGAGAGAPAVAARPGLVIPPDPELNAAVKRFEDARAAEVRAIEEARAAEEAKVSCINCAVQGGRRKVTRYRKVKSRKSRQTRKH